MFDTATFETAWARESGSEWGLFDEKSEDRKSRDTVPSMFCIQFCVFWYRYTPHCKFFPIYSACMTLKIMTSALEASGPKKSVFPFPTLLDVLAPILTIFPLKMQKSRKSAHPTSRVHSIDYNITIQYIISWFFRGNVYINQILSYVPRTKSTAKKFIILNIFCPV
jgi:hypothetical protein